VILHVQLTCLIHQIPQTFQTIRIFRIHFLVTPSDSNLDFILDLHILMIVARIGKAVAGQATMIVR